MIRCRWFCRCKPWQGFTWAGRWRLFDGWNCMSVTRAVCGCCSRQSRICIQYPAFLLSFCSSNIFCGPPILELIPSLWVTIPFLRPFSNSWTGTSSGCRRFPFLMNRSWLGFGSGRIFWITKESTYDSRNRGLWRLQSQRRTCKRYTWLVRMWQGAFDRCSFKKLFD